ncbi:hypothetical protein ES703_11984 [subsurface metagenome]
MGNLRSLVVKEIKELVRDPKILLGVVLMPLIMYPIMGSAMNISQQSMMRAMASASFAVYNEDEGVVVDSFLEYIYTNNTVHTIEAGSLEDAIMAFQDTNASTLLYVREGYSDNVTQGVRAYLKLYANLKSLSIVETESPNAVSGLINIYSYYLSISKIEGYIAETGGIAEADSIRSPIRTTSASIIKGNVLEVAPSAIFSIVMNQSITLPMMTMLTLVFAIQMAATSIALEKEEKTLETLMTLPVSRMTILGGKLAGSIVVSIFGAIASMAGFGYYMNSAFAFAPEMTSMATEGFSLGLKPFGLALVGINIFITLVSALALAICLSVFSDSVRGAQSLTGILFIPIFIPAMILMFSDIKMLPTTMQWILLAIPYTHSILASKAAFLGDYSAAIGSIAYITAFTVVVLYIAARIFSTERILTSRFTLDRIRNLFRRR